MKEFNQFLLVGVIVLWGLNFILNPVIPFSDHWSPSPCDPFELKCVFEHPAMMEWTTIFGQNYYCYESEVHGFSECLPYSWITGVAFCFTVVTIIFFTITYEKEPEKKP